MDWPAPQKIFAALQRACGRADCNHVIEFDGSDVAIAPCRTCGRKWEVRTSGIRPVKSGTAGVGDAQPEGERSTDRARPLPTSTPQPQQGALL